jgi:uroporphyrinogen-III synthase
MEIGFLRHEKILPELSSLLLKSGLRTFYFPLVTYQAIDFTIDPQSLPQYTGIILCSKRAVEIFFSKVTPDDCNSLIIYCVGERAKIKLLSYGLQNLLCYPNFLEMSEKFSHEDNLLYPASNEYSQIELDIAKKKCSNIQILICYKVIYEKMDRRFQEWLEAKGNKALAVLAPSQAKVLESYECKNIDAFCMGQRTKKALEKIRLKQIHLSKESNLLSLISSLQEYFN